MERKQPAAGLSVRSAQASRAIGRDQREAGSYRQNSEGILSCGRDQSEAGSYRQNPEGVLSCPWAEGDVRFTARAEGAPECARLLSRMALAEREKIITVMHVTVTRSGTRAKVDYRTAIADEQWVEEQIDRDAIAAYARDLSRYLEIMDWLEKIGDQPHPRKATWKRMADHLFKSAEISHEAILPPDPPPFAEEIRKAVEKADRWYRRLHSVNA